jgi:hypothetical protein
MSAPAAPTNALSMNKGNGSCEIQWSASVNAVSYNVYLATSLTGTYRKANLKPILGTVTRLPNLKFGLTVFFKVTAVNAAGEESALSTVAEDATCSAGTVILQFTGLIGDVIPAGAIFTARVGQALVSFRTLTTGTVAPNTVVSSDGATVVSPDGATVVSLT